MSTRGIELNLPDLPEVALSLGADGAVDPALRPPWAVRLWNAAGTALPLLLMGLLAVGSWWLVRNATPPPTPERAALGLTEPDYAMTGVTLERYGADGRLRLMVQGRELRHLPAADRLEVDDATVRVFSPSGSETVATARQVLTSAQAQEVQLVGGARVLGLGASGQPAQISGEWLRLFPKDGRVRSEQPVQMQLGASTVQAKGLDYDHKSGMLTLDGPLRAEFAPAPPPAPTRR